MRNKITDLNNHLFEQLERLNDDSLSDTELEKEITRSKAMTNVANAIIESSRVTVDAMKVLSQGGVDISRLSTDVIFHKLEE